MRNVHIYNSGVETQQISLLLLKQYFLNSEALVSWSGIKLGGCQPMWVSSFSVGWPGLWLCGRGHPCVVLCHPGLGGGARGLCQDSVLSLLSSRVVACHRGVHHWCLWSFHGFLLMRSVHVETVTTFDTKVCSLRSKEMTEEGSFSAF